MLQTTKKLSYHIISYQWVLHYEIPVKKSLIVFGETFTTPQIVGGINKDLEQYSNNKDCFNTLIGKTFAETFTSSFVS